MGQTRPAIFLFLLITTTTTTTTFTPYERGPHNTTHILITTTNNPELLEEVEVWVPTDVGLYDVFYFLTGLGDTIPAVAYNELFHHMASHGVAVVAPWSVSLPLNPVEKVPYLEAVMEWTEANLHEQLYLNGVQLGVVLNLDNYVLGGHSSGAHLQVEYLKKSCGRVTGQVWLSPVDGIDPAGLVPVFCIKPGTFLNYGTPTLLIAAGYDAVPGGSGFACAPEKLSNSRFYNAIDTEMAPKWFINATNYAHADLLDQIYIEIVEGTNFCSHNPELTLEEHDVYRRYVGGQIVAFVKALYTIDEENCNNYLSYIQNPSLMSIEAEVKYENPKGVCPKASCTWYHP